MPRSDLPPSSLETYRYSHFLPRRTHQGVAQSVIGYSVISGRTTITFSTLQPMLIDASVSISIKQRIFKLINVPTLTYSIAGKLTTSISKSTATVCARRKQEAHAPMRRPGCCLIPGQRKKTQVRTSVHFTAASAIRSTIRRERTYPNRVTKKRLSARAWAIPREHRIVGHTGIEEQK